MAEDTLLTTETSAEPVEETASGTWREALPDDLREAGSLKDIPDIPTLAKAYTDAQSYIGRSTRIPTEDASEEVWDEFRGKLTQVPGVGLIPTEESSEDDWSKFYNAMGRPENAEGYSIERPEGVEGNPEVESGLIVKAHELGLSNKQVSGLVNWMNQGLESMGEQSTTAHDDALETLKSDWGQAFDTKLKDARSALLTYGGEELVQEMNETGLGNNINLVKAFAEIGKGLSEDGPMNAGESRGFRTTPEEARQQIVEVTSNAAHPYNDDTHPQHRAEVERVSKLYQVAYHSDEPQTDFGQRFEGAITGQP